jgi:transposase
MDNLNAHKTPAVRALLAGSGLTYRHLPSCSPDLNPIELAWPEFAVCGKRLEITA